MDILKKFLSCCYVLATSAACAKSLLCVPQNPHPSASLIGTEMTKVDGIHRGKSLWWIAGWLFSTRSTIAYQEILHYANFDLSLQY